MADPRFARIAAVCGMIGPLLFGVIIAGLTFDEYAFLRTIGWDPVHALDWPSALALGPHGRLMTLSFLVSGALMSFFATGLRAGLAKNRLSSAGTTLLLLAGIALAGLAFSTDLTLRTTPATWHGILHDSFFVVLGLTLLPAMLLLGAAFRSDASWMHLAWYTFLTVALVVPAFWIKGGAFYLFLSGVLLWSEVISLRLFRLTSRTLQASQ